MIQTPITYAQHCQNIKHFDAVGTAIANLYIEAGLIPERYRPSEYWVVTKGAKFQSLESATTTTALLTITRFNGEYDDLTEIDIPVDWLDNFDESVVRAHLANLQSARMRREQEAAEKRAQIKAEQDLAELRRLKALYPDTDKP